MSMLRRAASLVSFLVMASVAHAETVKIGTILSTTGASAFLGVDMKDGMELAIKEINAKGGINGKKIEWIFYDAETQTSKGLAAARRLISQDKVDIIVGGGSNSGIALAIAPLAEQAKVPFISVEGAVAIVRSRQWAFKSTVDDSQVFERLADFFKKKGITKLALLHDTSGFGQSAAEELRSAAGTFGWTVTYEAFAPSDTDLTAQLTRIKNSGAQAIINWTVTPAGLIFIKQAKQLGLGDRTLIHSYGFVAQRYMQLAGDDIKDVLLVSVKFPVGDDLPADDPVKEAIKVLTEKFRAEYKRDPNQYVAQSYDAIRLAAHALAAGGADKEAVRKALEGIRGYNGVGGRFNFSEQRHSGLSKSDLILLTWKDSKFRLVDYK